MSTFEENDDNDVDDTDTQSALDTRLNRINKH